ncbi:MAG: DUF948 domain-containing protein [Desulfobacteraceae bacterium]|nr:DUF948 domain-containing protein [Desulfobacteraceae bacterium]
MQFSWTDIAALVSSLAFIFLALYLSNLIKKAVGTLSQTEAAMASIQKAADVLCQAGPVLKRLEEFEDAARNTLLDMQKNISALKQDIEPLIKDCRGTADAWTRLANSMDDKVNHTVAPVIENVGRVSSSLCDVTESIKDKVSKTDDFFEAARQTGETVRMMSGLVNSGITGVAAQIAGVATGIKASVDFLSERFIKKGGKYGL